MKQKYLVGKGEDKNEIIIQEMAEMEKKVFSIICEKTYKAKELKKQADAGAESLIAFIRQPDFFPPFHIAEKLAVAVEEALGASGQESVEVLIDELESSREAEAALEDDDPDIDEDGDIDELLEDDLEEIDPDDAATADTDDD